jgi:hypothetical protein
MKIKIKPWKYGATTAHYEDIPPELLVFEAGVYVLPADFFYEKGHIFTLVKRYEPGEKQGFPHGGFEVRDSSGGIRSFDLDQVIVHPRVINHKPTLRMIKEGSEESQRGRPKSETTIVYDEDEPKVPGKRGRRPLSDEEKQKREYEKVEKQQRSGGKRGRPKSTEPKPSVKSDIPKGKRGRPTLDPDIKAKRELEDEKRKKKSGGKRGRPRKS